MNTEYFETVAKLNYDLYEKQYENRGHFLLESTGDYNCIKFGGILLWDEENDDREWLDDDFEPLYPFVRKKFFQLIDDMDIFRHKILRPNEGI